jgi:hypothetical protein
MREPEIDTMTATARLPKLDIEIVHRRSPSGDAEQISINLQAAPSFEAFGRYVETANPLAVWAEVTRVAWLSWIEAATFLPSLFLQPLSQPRSVGPRAR